MVEREVWDRIDTNRNRLHDWKVISEFILYIELKSSIDIKVDSVTTIS